MRQSIMQGQTMATRRTRTPMIAVLLTWLEDGR